VVDDAFIDELGGRKEMSSSCRSRVRVQDVAEKAYSRTRICWVRLMKQRTLNIFEQREIGGADHGYGVLA